MSNAGQILSRRCFPVLRLVETIQPRPSSVDAWDLRSLVRQMLGKPTTTLYPLAGANPVDRKSSA
jgi:hypothetical protein